MEEKSALEGKVVIVKFHEGEDTTSRNTIITRTLGKFGVIATSWYNEKRPDEIPRAGEFWKVRIGKEIGVGRREGCFVLYPMEKVHVTDLSKLIPGMYSQDIISNVCIVVPNRGVGKGNWILPLAIRKQIRGVYAIIVDLPEN